LQDVGDIKYVTQQNQICFEIQKKKNKLFKSEFALSLEYHPPGGV